MKKTVRRYKSRSKSKSPSKRVLKRSRSRSRSRSRKRSKNLTCSQELRRKVAINIKEGGYASTEQAVAVAYSQVRKMRPGCKKILKKKL
jgi:hypothetical protein